MHFSLRIPPNPQASPTFLWRFTHKTNASTGIHSRFLAQDIGITWYYRVITRHCILRLMKTVQVTVKIPVPIHDALVELVEVQHARLHAHILAAIYLGLRAIRNHPEPRKLLNTALSEIDSLRRFEDYELDLGPLP